MSKEEKEATIRLVKEILPGFKIKRVPTWKGWHLRLTARPKEKMIDEHYYVQFRVEFGDKNRIMVLICHMDDAFDVYRYRLDNKNELEKMRKKIIKDTKFWLA